VTSYLLERGVRIDVAIETARRKDWHLTEIWTVSERLKAYESNIKQIKSLNRRDLLSVYVEVYVHIVKRRSAEKCHSVANEMGTTVAL
jgi:hypothetical protein